MVAGYSGEPYKLLPDPGPTTLPGQPVAEPAGGHRAAVPSWWAVTPRGHHAGTVQAAPRVLLALATRPRDERPPHRPWGPRSCGGAPPSPPRAPQQDYGEPGAEPKADQPLANFPSRPAYPARRCGPALSRFSGARRGQPGARGQPEGARCLPSREPRPQSRARRWQGTARGHHSCSRGLLLVPQPRGHASRAGDCPRARRHCARVSPTPGDAGRVHPKLCHGTRWQGSAFCLLVPSAASPITLPITVLHPPKKAPVPPPPQPTHPRHPQRGAAPAKGWLTFPAVVFHLLGWEAETCCNTTDKAVLGAFPAGNLAAEPVLGPLPARACKAPRPGVEPPMSGCCWHPAPSVLPFWAGGGRAGRGN